MSTKNTQVTHYIANASEFAQPILEHLRALVHQGCPEAEETLKWGFPHFMYKGILCSMASFKGHCAFGFWKGKVLFQGDPAAKQKSQEAMGHFGRITTLADLPSEKVLLGYIREAARLNDAGVKVPTRSKPAAKKPLVIPDYMTAALKKNKRAQEAFEDFSYSHKKEYVEWITEAKGEDTRQRRLSTAIEWMAEGKPRHWKYANC